MHGIYSTQHPNQLEKSPHPVSATQVVTTIALSVLAGFTVGGVVYLLMHHIAYACLAGGVASLLTLENVTHSKHSSSEVATNTQSSQSSPPVTSHTATNTVITRISRATDTEGLEDVSEPSPPVTTHTATNTAVITHANKSTDTTGLTTNLHDAVWKGDIKGVLTLLKKPDTQVNAPNEMGRTPLHLAAVQGNLPIVQALLKHPKIDVKVATKDGETPLHTAAYWGQIEVLGELLKHPNIDVNVPKYSGYKHHETLLYWAARYGHIDVARALLNHPNIDANAPDQDGISPLQYAAYEGHIQVVREFLRQSTLNVELDVNAADKNGVRPLCVAALLGHTGVVELLLSHPNIDVNIRQSNGFTALDQAALKGNLDVVKILLKHPDIDVNALNSVGKPLLFAAVAECPIDVVRALLSHTNIDVNFTPRGCCTPLDLAMTKGRIDVMQALLSHPRIQVGVFKKGVLAPLNWAVVNGKMEAACELLKHPRINANIPDDLKTALEKGHHEVARMVVQHSTFKATAHLKNMEVFIHWAVREGHTMVLEAYLKRKDADPNITNPKGMTLLHLAAAHKHVKMTQILVRLSNIKVNAVDEDGATPLFHAAANIGYGEYDIICALRDHPNIDVNAANSKGKTPLHAAVRSFGGEQVIQKLLVHPQIQVNTTDKKGRTPLYLAALNKRCNCVKVLLKHQGVNVNATAKDGTTPLDAAIKSANPYTIAPFLLHPDTVGTGQTLNRLRSYNLDEFLPPFNFELRDLLFKKLKLEEKLTGPSAPQLIPNIPFQILLVASLAPSFQPHLGSVLGCCKDEQLKELTTMWRGHLEANEMFEIIRSLPPHTILKLAPTLSDEEQITMTELIHTSLEAIREEWNAQIQEIEPKIAESTTEELQAWESQLRVHMSSLETWRQEIGPAFLAVHALHTKVSQRLSERLREPHNADDEEVCAILELMGEKVSPEFGQKLYAYGLEERRDLAVLGLAKASKEELLPALTAYLAQEGVTEALNGKTLSEWQDAHHGIEFPFKEAKE